RAEGIGAPVEARHRLPALGVAINSIAYGDDASVVLIPPAELFALMLRHADPLAFAAREPVAGRISEGRERDLAQAASLPFLWDGPTGRVPLRPDEAWAPPAPGRPPPPPARAPPATAPARGA